MIGTVSDVINDEAVGKLTSVKLDLVRLDVAVILHEVNPQRKGWFSSCSG